MKAGRYIVVPTTFNPGDTGQFLLRYTLHISWFPEIQDSSFSGIHYIYHGSWRYRTIPSQVYTIHYIYHGSWRYRTVEAYVNDDVFGLVDLYISWLFGDDVSGLIDLNIYIGCLVMMCLVWLSFIYI